jgi:hypothetical protein
MSNFIICTIANFNVVVTISKENIYLSRFMQMSNRLNFGIGNSFFKLPCGGKGLFFMTRYLEKEEWKYCSKEISAL